MRFRFLCSHPVHSVPLCLAERRGGAVRLLAIAILSAAGLAAQPTVTITWPTPSQNVAHNIPISGTASSTAGSITTLQESIDGGAFTTFTSGTGNSSWVDQHYGPPVVDLSLGPHTIAVKAIDSMSNSGTSPTLSFTVINSNPVCPGTIGTGVSCVEAHAPISANGATTQQIVFTGPVGGDIILISTGGSVFQHYPFQPGMISDSNGYSWKFFPAASSGFPDDDLSQSAYYCAYVPSTSSGADTITIQAPDITNPLSHFGSYAVELRGPTCDADQSYGTVSSIGSTATGSTGNYDTSAGNLCIAIIGGAPMYAPSGWIELVEDNARPFAMIVAQIASGSPCNVTWANSITDGAGSGGISLRVKSHSVYTGQSLLIGPTQAATSTLPTQSTNQVELALHDFDLTGTVPILNSGNATGWVVSCTTPTTCIAYNEWNTPRPTTSVCNGGNPVIFDVSPYAGVRMRLGENQTTKQETVEVWDSANNRIVSGICPFSTSTPANTGFQLGNGSAAHGVKAAYVRISNAILPFNSAPPTTVDSNPGGSCVLQWKLDGSGADSCGSHPATMSGSAASYSLTTLNYPVAQIRTQDWDGLLSIKSQRAGHSILLDGSQSTSQSDTANTFTCSWVQLYGPTTFAIDNPSACRTSMEGTIYGDYRFKLTVTDDQGIQSFAIADIGSVATDSNNVVVQANPLADWLYGPMMRYGSSPWEYEQYWHKAAGEVRSGTVDPSLNVPPYTGKVSITATSNTNPDVLTMQSSTFFPGLAQSVETSVVRNGGFVWISGCTGDTAPNGIWRATNVNIAAGSFTLLKPDNTAVIGNGVYTGGCVMTTNDPAIVDRSSTGVTNGIKFSNIQLQAGNYQNIGWLFGGQGLCNRPIWECITGYSGSVSYSFNGGGWSLGNTSIKTSLNAAITTTTQTSIVITDASSLDFSDVPGVASRIVVYSQATPSINEEIRICAVSGTAPATLTVCYDGRGQFPRTWTNLSDTAVTQSKVKGTGTGFITAAFHGQMPVSPLGIGPPGGVSCKDGTITATPGSATVTLAGATWSLANCGESGILPYIRWAGTHGGGSAFVFWAKVCSFTDSTHLTMCRVYPSDADNNISGTAYTIMPGTRTLDLRYASPYVATGEQPEYAQAMFATTGIESDTAAYINPMTQSCTPGSGPDANMGCNSYAYSHDASSLNGTNLNGTVQTGVEWSVVDKKFQYANTGGQGGISFYGEGTAHSAMCLASGLANACQAADLIDDYWYRSPWADLAVSGMGGYYAFGQLVSTFQAKLVRGRPITWATVRTAADYASKIATGYGNLSDPAHCTYFGGATRDLAGYLSALVLAAEYDPDSTFRAKWLTGLNNMQTGDNACKGIGPPTVKANSFDNTAQWYNQYGATRFNLIGGSASGTVSSGTLPASLCNGVTNGTGTIVNNGTTFTVTGGTVTPQVLDPTFPATAIVLTGTLSGVQYSVMLEYTVSGSTVTLSGHWPGDTGTITWMTVRLPLGTSPSNANSVYAAFATGPQDFTDLLNVYACLGTTGGTTFTLSAPWLGTNGAYQGGNGFPVPIGADTQQPFMNGVNVSVKLAPLADWNPATNPYADHFLDPLPANYATLNGAVEQWVHDYGVDQNTWNTTYFRVVNACEPLVAVSGQFSSIQPACNYGATTAAEVGGRQLSGEITRAIGHWYADNTSPTNKTFGDNLHSGIWGSLFNQGGVALLDSNTVAMNIPQSNLSFSGGANTFQQGKYFGYQEGSGGGYTWAARRLGGVLPASPRTYNVSFTLLGGASSVQLTTTAPSGAVTQTCSTTSPVSGVNDDRQGLGVYSTQQWSNGTCGGSKVGSASALAIVPSGASSGNVISGATVSGVVVP